MTTPHYTGDPKQLVILKRLTVLIEGVTVANGYDFNLAGKVYRGKTVFGASEAVPFVSILESLRPDPMPSEAGPEKTRREEDWELLVQGWGYSDASHPVDGLYRLKAAVEHRLSRIVALGDNGSPLYAGDYRLGRILTGARIGPGVVRAATPQTGGVEAFYLPVIARYVNNTLDPWVLA